MSQDKAASWGSVPFEQSLWPHSLDCNDLSQGYEGAVGKRGFSLFCFLPPCFIGTVSAQEAEPRSSGPQHPECHYMAP